MRLIGAPSALSFISLMSFTQSSLATDNPVLHEIDLIVVIDTDAAERDGSAGGRQPDALEMASALRGTSTCHIALSEPALTCVPAAVPGIVDAKADPFSLCLLPPPAPLSKKELDPEHLAAGGIFRIKFHLERDDGLRLPVTVAVTYADRVGATVLCLTSSEAFLSSLAYDLSSRCIEDRCDYLAYSTLTAGLLIPPSVPGRSVNGP